MEAADAFGLDRVLWIPAAQSPHKINRGNTPPAVRQKLVESVLQYDQRFECSSIEIDRGGVSFTIDTLTSLARHMPGASLVLIMGDDSFRQFQSWKEPAGIAELARLVVYPRLSDEKPTDSPFAFDWLPVNRIAVSSTDIRDRVRTGLPVNDLIPEAVASLIQQYKLYQIN
jgi:nicotinate-nucleotide adenylyltransferase